ncbi:MAG: hypothetical protein RMJ97_11465, partial [Raineya sp.]|nr:hypothetical protein [Raineya sp.]
MFLWSQNVFGQIFSNFTEIVPLGPLCGRTLRPPIGINVECPTYPFHVGSESTFEGPSRFNAPAR